MGAVTVAKATSRAGVESPTYAVESEHEGWEVRRYGARLVAEVDVEGTPREATSAGFRLLADFIFGNNVARDEIAMTAPVDRTRSEKIAMTAPVDRTAKGDRWTVAFTMPSEYTLETLPRPNNPKVHIREIPPQTYAVMRFRGSPSEPVVQRRMDDLQRKVADAGLTADGSAPTYARYDPPWTPGFLRRNEIFVRLALPPES
jgi:hypothetical protein